MSELKPCPDIEQRAEDVTRQIVTMFNTIHPSINWPFQTIRGFIFAEFSRIPAGSEVERLRVALESVANEHALTACASRYANSDTGEPFPCDCAAAIARAALTGNEDRQAKEQKVNE